MTEDEMGGYFRACQSDDWLESLKRKPVQRNPEMTDQQFDDAMKVLLDIQQRQIRMAEQVVKIEAKLNEHDAKFDELAGRRFEDDGGPPGGGGSDGKVDGKGGGHDGHDGHDDGTH